MLINEEIKFPDGPSFAELCDDCKIKKQRYDTFEQK